MLARMRAATRPRACSEQDESRTERPGAKRWPVPPSTAQSRAQAATESLLIARLTSEPSPAPSACRGTECGMDVTVSGRRSGAGEAATTRGSRSRRALSAS